MKKIKLAAIIASVSALAVSFAISAAASQVTDISGHWSEDYVEYGIEKGYINGYPDNTFLPDKAVTRAEFAKMTNSALGITKTADISFEDVGKNEWFYSEVGKALYAGYVSGYEDGSFRAGNLITRQEAAVILSRIATRPESDKSTDSFADSKDIADWAKESLDYAYSKGFFSGDDLGKLNPLDTLTRGQAAKILYGLVTSENVTKDDYTVSLNQAVCSETVFTDDLYFDATGENPTLTIDGCTVLGTLYVRTTSNSVINIVDSNIKEIVCDTSFATINAKDGAKLKSCIVESPVKLSGDGVKTVVLKGSGLASDTTELACTVDKLEVYSDALVKAGDVKQLTLSDSASLTLQSGNVKKMDVESGAKGSVITLASGVYVEKLTVDGACSFMGAGKIGTAHNNVSGVSYAVQPEKLTGKTDSDKEDDKDDDKDDNQTSSSKYIAPTSVSPKSGETDVAISAIIGISFESALYDANGKAVTAGYIEQTVELRKSTKGGSKLYFEADLTSSRRFEMDPDGYLSAGVKYYVVIPAGTFKDENGNTNKEYSYYFVTRENYEDDDDSGSSSSGTSSVSGSISVTPSSGKTDVDIDEEIKITFPSAIRRQSGSAVTNSYLSNTAIELREKKSDGERVGIIAEINSTKKIVTVTPEEPLKPGTRYYVIITSGSLEYSTNGSNISKKSSYFTTSDDIGMTITPKNGATGVALDSEIVIKFNSEITLEDGSKIYDDDIIDIIELKKGTASGKDVEFDASIKDADTVTITPLDGFEAGQKYTIVIPAGVIANENETLNKKMTSYFTAISEMQPTITPKDGYEDTALSEKIVIKFGEPVCKDRKGTPIDEEYIVDSIIEKNYLTIYREGSTANLASTATVEISDDFTTITITPKKQLITNRQYTVTFASGKVWNEEGKKSNAKATSTFSTVISGIPEFSPEDGETEIAVDESIEIRFEDEMRTVDGASLSATYVQNKVVTIFKDDEDGEVVKFTAKLSNNNKTITITPKTDLEGGTTYVVVISAETMLDSRDNLNSKFVSTFETEQAVVKGSELVSPEHKDTGVAVDSEIVIKFNSALYKTTGDPINAEYFKNNGISIVTGSSSTERKNDFEFSVSEDGKEITITPKTVMDSKTKYTIKLLKGSVKYFNGTDITAVSYYFTTGDGIPVVNFFDLLEVGVDFVEFEVESSVDGILHVSADSGEDLAVGQFYEVEANEYHTFTLTGLEPDTEYILSYSVEDEDGVESDEVSFEIETAKDFPPEITEISLVMESDMALTKENPGTAYEVELPEGTTTVSVVVNTSDDEAEIKINGTSDADVDLEVGENQIVVNAISRTGKTSTCTITVIVPESAE